MKAILFRKSNGLALVAFVALTVSFSSISFSQNETSTMTSQQYLDIKKMLDASQKREEQILANQDKILNEILISRKWARRG